MAEEEKKVGKADEDEVKQRYLELQMAGKHIKKFHERVEALDEQLGAMEAVIQSLDELKSMEEGAEMLSPISEGIFVKGTLKDSSKLIVNVGANIAVPKTVDEAKELLRSRIGQGMQHRSELIDELQQLVDVPLGRERHPDLVQLVQLGALAGEGAVELRDHAAAVDGVERT
ncbi:prefoldin subunit alpha [Candidatus Woesearchaeota archaeon]|nr:prefoldin subunit alpha [Candidatus Woesearchaeota archaeon]